MKAKKCNTKHQDIQDINMGRYYSGDINGKFWFGTQSSGDASHFGGVFTITNVYQMCSCPENGNRYCTDCYSSYEEHAEDAEIEEGESLLFESTIMPCHVMDIDEVRTMVELLESQVGYAIKSYTIDKANGYDYDLSQEDWNAISADSNDSTKESLRVYVARLCFGKQILAWMEDHPNENCVFNVEC